MSYFWSLLALQRLELAGVLFVAAAMKLAVPPPGPGRMLFADIAAHVPALRVRGSWYLLISLEATLAVALAGRLDVPASDFIVGAFFAGCVAYLVMSRAKTPGRPCGCGGGRNVVDSRAVGRAAALTVLAGLAGISELVMQHRQVHEPVAAFLLVIAEVLLTAAGGLAWLYRSHADVGPLLVGLIRGMQWLMARRVSIARALASAEADATWHHGVLVRRDAWRLRDLVLAEYRSSTGDTLVLVVLASSRKLPYQVMDVADTDVAVDVRLRHTSVADIDERGAPRISVRKPITEAAWNGG